MKKLITLRTKLRKEYTNYSQQDIANKIGVTKQYISQYENGKAKSDKLDIMYLEFRKSEIDIKIIDFLKERNKNEN